MAQWYECFDCRNLSPISDGDNQSPEERKCSTCGTTHGQVISHERMKDGLEAGVFFNIDPRTGKRAKKKR